MSDILAEATLVDPAWADPQLAARVRSSGHRLVVIDTETTGLCAYPGSVTEVAWYDIGARRGGAFVPTHDIRRGTVYALELSRYGDRLADAPRQDELIEPLWRLLGGDGTTTHLVGSNPHFDAEHLTALFRRAQLAPPWSHRLIDPVAAYPWLTADDLVPAGWGLARVAAHAHIDNAGHHAALNDVEVTAQIWQVAMYRRDTQTGRAHPAGVA